MKVEADVKISKAEMRRGLKVSSVGAIACAAQASPRGFNQLFQDLSTACMDIKSDILVPTRCYSKAGARWGNGVMHCCPSPLPWMKAYGTVVHNSVTFP